MREHRSQVDKPGLVIESSRLHGRNFIPAQALADDIETAGQRGIAEGSLIIPERRADRPNK
jgi:hypothetical protein